MSEESGCVFFFSLSPLVRTDMNAEDVIAGIQGIGGKGWWREKEGDEKAGFTYLLA